MSRGPDAEMFADYAARIRPKLLLREITPAAGSPGEIRKREGEKLLAATGPRDLVVALDLGGGQIRSEDFAVLLQTWTQGGRLPAFVIGGAEGLDRAVVDRASHVLSLGAMTWPHMLVRIMLAEQIFRAQCVASGHPYHRGFRA